MNFKPIAPGTAIHCPTKENARALLRHLKRKGYFITEDDMDVTGEGDSTLFERAYIDAPFLIDTILVGRREIQYDTREFYERMGYRIIEFDDVMEIGNEAD